MNDSLIQVKEKILSLEKAMLERHPRMPILLQEIHAALKAQPENVTLLPEEEICILVKGLQHQTGVFLAESVVKKKSSTGIQAKIRDLGDDAF
jgi:hypothetical protein